MDEERMLVSHRQTYDGFVRISVIGTVLVALLLIVLALTLL